MTDGGDIRTPASATRVPSPPGRGWSGRSGRQVGLHLALTLCKWLALVALAVFILGPLIVMAIWAFAGEWTGSSLLPQLWSLQVVARCLEPDRDHRLDRAQPGDGHRGDAPLDRDLPARRLRLRALPLRRRQPLLLAFLAANAFPKFGLYVTILTIFYQIHFDDTVQGIVVIQMLETLVFMIWIPATAFQNIDRSLEEAALDAGCSRIGTFMRITLPLAAPAIAVAMLLSFVAALDESQGTLMVGLPDQRDDAADHV